MAFELKRKESVPQGVRRIACERLDKAIKALDASRRSALPDAAVHEARKQFKQVRGVLRLIRQEMGRKRFDRENRAFRDAGRPLSEVRDAKVLIDTLEMLAEHFSRELAKGSFKELRAALRSRRTQVRQNVLGKRSAARAIAAEVRRARRRVEDWPLRHKGWKAIAAGLRRTYSKGRGAMKQAIRRASDESVHEWRKRSKDLRYELELLAPSWPQTVEPMAQLLHDLTDLLGQDHDLAVLREIAVDELRDRLPEEEVEMIQPLVTQRREELQKQAIELGERLFAEKPREFTRRLHEYWKVWRASDSDKTQ